MPGPASDRNGFRLPWRLTRSAISLGLLVFLLSQVDLSASLATVAGARVDLLALLLLAFLIDRLMAAYRWYVLLSGRIAGVSYSQVLRLMLASGFVGYFIPGGLGADILRVYGLAQTTSDLLLSVSSVLVDRLFGFVALAVLVLIGLALQPPGLPATFAQVAWAGLALVVLAVMALMLPTFRRLTLELTRITRLTFVRTRVQKLYGALDAYARQRSLMLGSLALALLFQFVRCLQPAIGAAALDASLPFAVFLTVVPLVVLLALLPVSVAGLGVQDLGYVYLFGLAGMPIEVALPLSLLIHIFILLSTLPGAWLYARHGLRG